jgi:hypothetical protein
MPKRPPEPAEEDDTARRRDEALKRALNTPPKPHKKDAGQPKPSQRPPLSQQDRKNRRKPKED